MKTSKTSHRTMAVRPPAMLVAALLIVVCPTRVAAQRTLALTGVTVVDVVQGRLVPAQTLVLIGGRIDRIGPDGETLVPLGAQFVEGVGRFLIPGLWDMHVHEIEREETLPLHLAHGVTGVRAMGGDARACIDVRDRVESGELLGPRIVTAGPFLDGRWPGEDRWELATADDALAAVQRLTAARADFAKVHEALPAQAFDAVMDAAREIGLPVAGHVPRSVTHEEAVAAGMASIEHVNLLAERLLTRASMASEEALDAEIEALLAGRAATLFASMVEHGTAFTPTLIAHEGILRGADPDAGAWDDPRLAWLPPTMAGSWRSMLPVEQLPGGFVRERRFVHRASRALVRGLHDAGVPLLAGSDVGAPHVFPGSALHDELQQLVACGLSAAEALRAATTTPASFLDRADALGQVAPGFAADLVLLDADPLQDIANVRRIAAVITRGRLLDRDALEALLATPTAAALQVQEPATDR